MQSSKVSDLVLKTFKFGLARAELRILGKNAYLHNVISQDRGKGHANGVMEQVVAFADEQELRLELVVSRFHYSDDKSLDNEQLVKFYEKFGFEKITDGPTPVMIRSLERR